MFVPDRDFDQLLKLLLKTNSALGYEGQPEDVANLVSFLVSEKAGYITGQVVSFFFIGGIRKIEIVLLD